MLRSGSIMDDIIKYQEKIKKLQSNFMLITAMDTLVTARDTNVQVHRIQQTLTTMVHPNVQMVQAAQYFNSCPRPSRIFHGRQAILDQMSNYFKQDDGKQHVYLLYGLGGSGKTQLALKFIAQSLTHFSDIFLIDTSTIGAIETGLKSIAVAKSSGTAAEDALLWLTRKQEQWLLLFDNADDPKINLNTWLPQCDHGNIIITSRNPELCVYAGSSTQVSDMQETEAVELLIKAAVQKSTPENIKIAAEIVKVLYYLPLAIVQAGAFIAKSGSMDI
ncbi:P-loop containing nucleoside triphosphate hydrolase protein [Mycena pura]|uniref:P-loop containing nucleoside triphosphate hydrolase protein n=1 Tax=Mycena pura TaxID=153505 RepID=A0AAD6Y204_9AGAR|nr:P-loop containing nucleoside triphosphate hydrolase protein [Mycena pura]